jgi:PHD/YefM family antitoxin component YafN of YafNO toxin-antitoxin module
MPGQRPPGASATLESCASRVSKLRENVYGILDLVLETGVPVAIERRGKLLRIICIEPPDKLARLQKRDYLRVEPEALIHLDWVGESPP